MIHELIEQDAKAWRQFLKDANIDGAGDYQETVASIVGSRKAEKRLIAYQRAFNKIDDLMEYRGMDKAQFRKIAAELTSELAG